MVSNLESLQFLKPFISVLLSLHHIDQLENIRYCRKSELNIDFKSSYAKDLDHQHMKLLRLCAIHYFDTQSMVQEI